jgi:hypothetical protein
MPTIKQIIEQARRVERERRHRLEAESRDAELRRLREELQRLQDKIDAANKQ